MTAVLKKYAKVEGFICVEPPGAAGNSRAFAPRRTRFSRWSATAWATCGRTATTRTPASVLGGPTCGAPSTQVTPRVTETRSGMMSPRRSSRTSPLRSWHQAPSNTVRARHSGIAAASSTTWPGVATVVGVAGRARPAPRIRHGLSCSFPSSTAVARIVRSNE